MFASFMPRFRVQARNMAGERVYLDYNATAPLLASARAAALAALDCLGNPSSVHGEGRAARKLVEDSRQSVAGLMGVAPGNVVFTSGGTEAANLALRARGAGSGTLIAGAGEHPCVLEGHGRVAGSVAIAPLRADGVVDLGALESLLSAAGAGALVALQAANNETGAMQPVAEAAALAHRHGAELVCDAVQVPGRVRASEVCAGADYIVLSAHKIGGLKGAGALVCRNGAPDPAMAMVRGGGQERGLRAGTENVAAIAAFGAACAWALAQQQTESERLAGLRDRFEQALLARFPDAHVFARQAARLPNTSAFAIPGMAAETALIALDLAGLAVSSGSACSSGKVKSSHVLEAMGVAPDIAKGALRVSIGHASGWADLEALLAGLDRCAARLRRDAVVAAA